MTPLSGSFVPGGGKNFEGTDVFLFDCCWKLDHPYCSQAGRAPAALHRFRAGNGDRPFRTRGRTIRQETSRPRPAAGERVQGRYNAGVDVNPYESPQPTQQELLPIRRRLLSLPLVIVGATAATLGVPTLALELGVQIVRGRVPADVIFQSAALSVVGVPMLWAGLRLRRPKKS
jgi:hypothetical protein